MSARHLDQQPQTLIGFLRSIGGLRSCDEVTARELRKVYPGLVNDKRGLSLDKAREACAEAGFLGFNADNDMGETTVNDFLDSLDSHPHYRPCDSEKLWAWEMMKARAAEIAEAFEGEIERISGPLPPYVKPAEPDVTPHDDAEPLPNARHEKALAWRKSRGLSRPKLAELTGYSERAIQNFEAGSYSGKHGTEALIPPRAWRAYALACADIEAKFKTPF